MEWDKNQRFWPYLKIMAKFVNGFKNSAIGPLCFPLDRHGYKSGDPVLWISSQRRPKSISEARLWCYKQVVAWNNGAGNRGLI